MYRNLALFFACITAAFAGGAATRLAMPQFERPAPQGRYDEDIVFPMKVFVGTKAYPAAKGTLSGE